MMNDNYRRTRKQGNGYVPFLYTWEDCVNKLGRLEDLECKFDCDLETIISLILNSVYIVEDNKLIMIDKPERFNQNYFTTHNSLKKFYYNDKNITWSFDKEILFKTNFKKCLK